MKIIDIFKKLFDEPKNKDLLPTSLDEEAIKLEAYLLWEKNPNEGDSEYYWNKARQKIEKQQC
jgi:hypothetical protein